MPVRKDHPPHGFLFNGTLSVSYIIAYSPFKDGAVCVLNSLESFNSLENLVVFWGVKNPYVSRGKNFLKIFLLIVQYAFAHRTVCFLCFFLHTDAPFSAVVYPLICTPFVSQFVPVFAVCLLSVCRLFFVLLLWCVCASDRWGLGLLLLAFLLGLLLLRPWLNTVWLFGSCSLQSGFFFVLRSCFKAIFKPVSLGDFCGYIIPFYSVRKTRGRKTNRKQNHRKTGDIFSRKQALNI